MNKAYYHSGGLEPDQYDRDAAAVIFGSLMGGYLPDLRDPGVHWVGGTIPSRGSKIRNSRQAYKQPASSPVSPVDVLSKTPKKRATGRIARCTAPGECSAPDLPPPGYLDPVEIAPGVIVDHPESGKYGRPTCPRCGREFRKSGIGLAWHVENYRQCAGRVTA